MKEEKSKFLNSKKIMLVFKKIKDYSFWINASIYIVDV